MKEIGTRGELASLALAEGPFTLSESENDSKKDQRTIRKDQSISGKHQRKFLLSLSLSLSVNGPLDPSINLTVLQPKSNHHFLEVIR